MSWGDWFLVYPLGIITGVCLTLTVLRPWRAKVTIEAETDR